MLKSWWLPSWPGNYTACVDKHGMVQMWCVDKGDKSHFWTKCNKWGVKGEWVVWRNVASHTIYIQRLIETGSESQCSSMSNPAYNGYQEKPRKVKFAGVDINITKWVVIGLKIKLVASTRRKNMVDHSTHKFKMQYLLGNWYHWSITKMFQTWKQLILTNFGVLEMKMSLQNYDLL